MAAPIDQAFVEILPDFSRFNREMNTGLNTSMNRAASTTNRSMGRIGTVMTRTAAAAATAFAAVGTVISGIAITGGLTRLLDIEDAQAKLRGLGHDADTVGTIMDNALESVRGTAFGLGEAATIAANAVAAGVRPGRELERTLKLIGDTATIAGTSLEDIGSIFNQVAAGGRLTTQEMNRLLDRGLPILQMLQDELGVTADEVRAMVTAGEVDFETFQRAIENNISGAALEGGETTRGAFRNMFAALNRVGANLLTGVFPLFQQFFQGVIDFLGPIEDTASRVGEALGSIANAFSEEGFAGGVARIREIFEGLDIGQSIQDTFAGVADFLTSNIDDIAAGIVDAREVFFNAASDVVLAVAQAFESNVPAIAASAATIVGVLLETIVGALPLLINASLTLTTGMLRGITQAIPEIVATLTAVLEDLVMLIVDAIPDFIDAGVELIAGLAEGLAVMGPQLSLAAARLIPRVVLALVGALPQLLTAGTRIMLAVIEGFLASLPALSDTIVNEFIPSMMEFFRDEAPQMIREGAEFISQFLLGVSESVAEIARLVSDEVIPAFTQAVRDDPDIVEAGVEAVVELAGAVAESAFLVADAVLTEVIPAFVEAFADSAPAIRDAGVDLIAALVESIADEAREVFDSGVETVENFVDGARDAVVNLPNFIADELIPGFVERLEDAPEIVEAGVQAIEDFIEGLDENLETLTVWIEETLLPSIVEGIDEHGPEFVETGGRILASLLAGVIAATPTIVEWFATQLMPAIVAAIIENLPGLIAAGALLVGALVIGSQRTQGRLLVFFQTLPARVIRLLLGFHARFFEVGANFVSGIIDGIQSRVGEVVDTARRAAEDAAAAMRGALGISSPSRVMRVVGEETMEGFGLGMGDGDRRFVQPQLDSILDDIVSPRPTRAGVDADADAARGGIPDEFTATAVIDLGEGIDRVVDVKFRRKDRETKRRVRAGTGSAR